MLPAHSSEDPVDDLGADGGCYLTAYNIKTMKDEHGNPAIENPEDSCFDRWCYNLRLGEEVYLSSEKHLTTLSGRQDSIVIEPGEFALLTTFEKLHVPLDRVGFISLRFRYALKGLINISGFHIDPGYEGRVVFSVYNAGPNPVVMRFKDTVFMVIFAHLDARVEPRRPSEFNRIEHLKSDWISAVKGPAVSLTKLNRRVERLASTVNLLITILGGVLVAAIGFFVLRIPG